MPHSNIETRTRLRARNLRKVKTRGEEEMWAYLRSFRPFGARFRRETPIGPYVVDFAWLSARMIIEVDGGSHGLPGRAERDREKDAYLQLQGLRVIRVRNANGVATSSAAFAPIDEALQPFLRTPSAAAQRGMDDPSPTPPHKGEGGSDAEAGTYAPAPSPSPQGGGERAAIAFEAEHRK